VEFYQWNTLPECFSGVEAICLRRSAGGGITDLIERLRRRSPLSSGRVFPCSHLDFFAFLEKIPQSGEFNDLLSRQDSGDQFCLRSGVDFVQMTL